MDLGIPQGSSNGPERKTYFGVVRYGMMWCVLQCRMARCGMVWYGMVWYGMVWYGMVWYGMVWYGMVCGAMHVESFYYARGNVQSTVMQTANSRFSTLRINSHPGLILTAIQPKIPTNHDIANIIANMGVDSLKIWNSDTCFFDSGFTIIAA